MKCLSLFSSGGLAETYFDQIGINVVLANELIPERCKFYKHIQKETSKSQKNIGKARMYLASACCEHLFTCIWRLILKNGYSRVGT